MGKFINPFTDVGFKKIFGQEVSKDLLIDFLNDLLVALRCFKGSFVGNTVAAAIAIPASYFFVAQWDMNGVSCTSIVAYAAGALIMVAFVASLFRKKAS